ncbi:MAG: PEP-CTERM sorting domain-containing protein [Verrucomicrobiaceae bacterium]|nr:PEP-CTERM sorting domain-containing protein [Verrucomicrobiaceae bacterium]
MKAIRALLTAILFIPSAGFGAVGIYDTFAFTSINGGGLNFYDAGATTVLPEFQGSTIGTFNRFTDTLQIGGQQKSFKNTGSDVTSHSTFWRILELGGAFTSVAMPFQWNRGDFGAPGNLNNTGDQQWGGNSEGANGNPIEISSNVFSGLLNGTYTLQFYTQITTNGVDAASSVLNDNGGSYYNANFTLVPEPSKALVAGLGLSALFFRRRRA